MIELTKKFKKCLDDLENYKKILVSSDSDLKKNVNQLLDDSIYLQHLESSSNLSSQFKSLIYNNVDNFKMLKKYYFTHIFAKIIC
jgi:predicted phage-related endonuclease